MTRTRLVAGRPALQRGMAARNEGMSDDGRINVRIGVHVGDVIIAGNDRYGDAVNIAARLQLLGAGQAASRSASARRSTARPSIARPAGMAARALGTTCSLVAEAK